MTPLRAKLLPWRVGLLLDPVTIAPPYMYTNTGKPEPLDFGPAGGPSFGTTWPGGFGGLWPGGGERGFFEVEGAHMLRFRQSSSCCVNDVPLIACGHVAPYCVASVTIPFLAFGTSCGALHLATGMSTSNSTNTDQHTCSLRPSCPRKECLGIRSFQSHRRSLLRLLVGEV